MTARILTGDCRELLGAAGVQADAVVCDPPYELGFMGKAWDRSGVAFQPETWRAVLEAARPGAHLVAFGGTRTHHRLMVAIEDAGWEIRDCLMWLYGSGFPKSHNGPWGGTALKPAWEPIILARNPLAGTVAANVTAHGTGALNIDACRVAGAAGSGVWGSSNATVDRDRKFNRSPDTGEFRSEAVTTEDGQVGRWPANVVLDEEAAELLDAQAPAAGAAAPVRGNESSAVTTNAYNERARVPGAFHGDRGGASRFFYCAKASRSERNRGLEGREKKALNWSAGEQSPGTFQSANTDRRAENHHPTVKPVDLMRWLCRLVTPRGGLVLDPFAGSGSTGIAAVAEGFDFLGIELNPEYAEIARARIHADAPLFSQEAS